MKHVRLVPLLVALLLTGCGTSKPAQNFEWVDATRGKRAGDAFQVRWTRPLAEAFGGRAIPVERAGVAADPGRQHLYVGSTAGVLVALGAEGSVLYHQRLGTSMESPPVVDPGSDSLFVALATGKIHKLTASTGEKGWEVNLDSPVSAPMALSKDALYIACDDDSVVALSRKDGEVLWRVRREPRLGFKIAGQAGILLHDGRVVTGFSDGTVISLDAGDGREHWHVNTSLDVEGADDDKTRFIDVDTAPVKIGEEVYAASFSGGLYVLDAQRGIVRRRIREFTGVIAMAADEHSLVLSSADHGVVCIDLASDTVRWRHRIGRGAPGQPRLYDGTVYVAESGGALLGLALEDGRELGRIESGHGFDGSPSLHDGRGFILSNAGTLFAFTY